MKNTSIFAVSRQVMITLSFLLLASQMAFAQPDEGPGLRHHHRFVEELGLDESQQALWRATRQGGKESKKGVRDLHQQLQEMVRSDQYSDSQVQILAQQIGEAMAANIVARANAEHAFYQSLTAEQKEKLQSMKRPKVRRFHIR